jgi:hypothetical protein
LWRIAAVGPLIEHKGKAMSHMSHRTDTFLSPPETHPSQRLLGKITSWQKEVPKTFAEWDMLRNHPDVLDQDGRSGGERWEFLRELSVSLAAMLVDRIPGLPLQVLFDFANPAPDLSQAGRQHLFRSALALVSMARLVTMFRNGCVDAVLPIFDVTLDPPGTAGAPISAPLAKTVRLLERAPRQIEIVKFLAGRMGQRIPLREITQKLCRANEPTRERVRTMRKQCERTRNALNDKVCPLRLFIQENSVWLEEHP